MPRQLLIGGYLLIMFLLATLVRWEYRRSKRGRKRGMLDPA